MARIVRLPVAAFVFGMEMVVLTLQGLQRFADEGLNALAGAAAVPGERVRDRAASPVRADWREPAARAGPIAEGTAETDRHAARDRQKETGAMPDTNLNDDMLKLVRYKVLFVKRDYEVAFPEQEELVYDNMTETAFTAWKIAEFVQRLNETPLPPKWARKSYPANQAEKTSDPDIVKKWEDEKNRGGERRVYWLPESDKKFLRVYFEVLSRYAREKFLHDEREVEVLEQIRDAIQEKGAVAPAGGGGRAPGKAAGAP
ncbi:MAG: hypothetical protein HYU37_09745 [Acidobacteria bacterium]|nr:hypothetical protein [Acidobacteriota bacterium]